MTNRTKHAALEALEAKRTSLRAKIESSGKTAAGYRSDAERLEAEVADSRAALTEIDEAIEAVRLDAYRRERLEAGIETAG